MCVYMCVRLSVWTCAFGPKCKCACVSVYTCTYSCSCIYVCVCPHVRAPECLASVDMFGDAFLRACVRACVRAWMLTLYVCECV